MHLKARHGNVDDRLDARRFNSVDDIRRHAGADCGLDAGFVAFVDKHDNGARCVARRQGHVFERVARGRVGTDDDHVGGVVFDRAQQLERRFALHHDVVAAAGEALYDDLDSLGAIVYNQNAQRPSPA